MAAPLPDPSPAALAHSARVRAAIDAAIHNGGGWLAFRDYMDICLHAPGLGYYAAGATAIGAAGDFVTAPETTPLFARTFARQVSAVLAELGAGEVLELGAGSGAFARDLLEALAEKGVSPGCYRILEPSPALRARQRETLAPVLARKPGCVAWLDSLPERFEGVIIGNEVLDAIACTLVVRGESVWLERGVRHSPDGALEWADQALVAADVLAAAEKRLPREGGYLSELNLQAEALVATLVGHLRRGALILIDYGFPAREYYHPERRCGTLMCHYRHRAHSDPLMLPGLQDITAHVDFTAIAEAGVNAGAELAGYATQARVLIALGILEELAAVGPPASTAYLRASNAVQRLLGPAEMGELFKVIGFARQIGTRWPAFAQGDQSHRL